MRGTDFPKGFSFGGCVLVSVEFHDADLPSAKFHDADLPSAKFHDSNLRSAEFPDANLAYAEFSDAFVVEAEFSDAFVVEAEFSDANLENAEFPRTNLQSVNFSDAYLNKTAFPNADLRGAEFPDVFLHRAVFPDADLRGAEFRRAHLRDAEFKKANLRGTDLTEANLQETEFFQTDLRGATFRPAYARVVKPVEVAPTDPLGASLEDAQFEDGTDLRGSDLSGARLYQTAFRDVRINDETTFGIDDGNPYGRACRYEYDPNTGVSTNEDVPRLRAAAWTYRRLESLFEENAMEERARDAHIRKEEAQRARYSEQVDNDDLSRGSWLKSLGQYAVSTLNWHLHRHGESLRQLLKMSALLIIGCGILYPFVGGIDSSQSGGPYRVTTLTEFVRPEGWVDVANGLYFSAITFTTIGYGDFYPAGTGSRILVALESLAGALLIALFVFVIGRRVAR